MEKIPKNIKRLLIGITVFGVLASILIYGWDEGRSPIFYWGIMPGLPFILIGLVGFLYRRQVTAGSLWGSSGAAFIITVLAYGALYYESITYTGGGANIGLGILLIPLPIYYAFLCWLGWSIGGKISRS